MTIVPFLKVDVFGPRDIQAMSTALQDVCAILNLEDHDKSEKEFLTKKLVALAKEGEPNAALLRDRMLREITSGRGEWPVALVRAARCGAL
jgi:hypothetical protein